MVEFPQKSIYLYNREIDFRKGIASLTSLIQAAFPDADLYNCLFIFFSKNARQVKIIEVERDNVWLYQNRLSNHRFLYKKSDKTMKITASELKLILKSVEPLKKSKRS